MNAKVETNSDNKDGFVDLAKWFVSVCVIAVGFYSYHHFDQFHVSYRILALIPVVLLSLWVATTTQKGGDVSALVRESMVEVRRVVWPSRQETTQTTMIVVAFVVLTALILWGLDAAFGKLVALVIG